MERVRQQSMLAFVVQKKHGRQNSGSHCSKTDVEVDSSTEPKDRGHLSTGCSYGSFRAWANPTGLARPMLFCEPCYKGREACLGLDRAFPQGDLSPQESASSRRLRKRKGAGPVPKAGTGGFSGPSARPARQRGRELRHSFSLAGRAKGGRANGPRGAGARAGGGAGTGKRLLGAAAAGLSGRVRTGQGSGVPTHRRGAL